MSVKVETVEVCYNSALYVLT